MQTTISGRSVATRPTAHRNLLKSARVQQRAQRVATKAATAVEVSAGSFWIMG